MLRVFEMGLCIMQNQSFVSELNTHYVGLQLFIESGQIKMHASRTSGTQTAHTFRRTPMRRQKKKNNSTDRTRRLQKKETVADLG